MQGAGAHMLFANRNIQRENIAHKCNSYAHACVQCGAVIVASRSLGKLTATAFSSTN